MKIVLRSFIAFLTAAITPATVFIILGFLFLYGSMSLRDVAGESGYIFRNIPYWALFAGFAFVIASMHAFLIGLPIFLLCWYFRVIHWWSILIGAFIIGAAPSTIYVLFFQNIGWSESTYLWQDINVISFGIVASMAIIMGLFGFSGGVAFWLLWRYWVSPDSPTGRPLSHMPLVANKASGVNS